MLCDWRDDIGCFDGAMCTHKPSCSVRLGGPPGMKCADFIDKDMCNMYYAKNGNADYVCGWNDQTQTCHDGNWCHFAA